MHIINLVLAKVAEAGLLQPLSPRLWASGSMYSDEVVLCLSPVMKELEAIQEIINWFGAISGLQTKINKCSAKPSLHSSGGHWYNTIINTMPWAIAEIPCTYLGLPLSVKKLRLFSNSLSTGSRSATHWKDAPINPTGHAVLTAIPTYHMMALNISRWVIKSIEKLWHVLLRQGRKERR